MEWCSIPFFLLVPVKYAAGALVSSGIDLYKYNASADSLSPRLEDENNTVLALATDTRQATRGQADK